MAEPKGQSKLPSTPWGLLPPRMRVLFITASRRAGRWLAEAFAADSATQVLLEEARGASAGLARLRDDSFDAVLINHEPDELNALELLDAVRAGSSPQQPILVLGRQAEGAMAALCFEAGADAYVCVESSTTRTLIWHLARAAERGQLISENRRLALTQRHRLQQEHDEANRLLAQQRALVSGLAKPRHEALVHEPPQIMADHSLALDCVTELPCELANHYRELLRAYVIMGSGRLSEEMHRLAQLLVSGGVTAQQVMLLHVRVLEEMVQNLGSRSARHVMNRADLLVMEVMINLAEGYRHESLARSTSQRTAFPIGLDLESSAV